MINYMWEKNEQQIFYKMINFSICHVIMSCHLNHDYDHRIFIILLSCAPHNCDRENSNIYD